MSHQNTVNAQGNAQNAANLAKLTPDVVKKLTEKLSELMGEDLTGGLEQAKNERGEFLNEEGLPIIEISEPVTEASAFEDAETALLIEESPLPYLASLSEPVRERLRQQRDNLLDQLEEEEIMQQRHEELTDVEHRQEILRKRKEAAAMEKEKLKATKEMQKKMGRVLLQNLAKERAQEEEEARVANAISDSIKQGSPGDKPKKTVSFADTFDHERSSEDVKQNVDWGDLVPARLRSNGRPSLSLPSETLPMKMNVVERTSIATPKLFERWQAPDSDDESDPEPLGDVAEDSDQDNNLEEEEFDLDFVQHQREVALQYHEKRDKIGAAALAAMSAHSHDDNGDVRLDPSLSTPSSEPEKPTISRFKATRLASSYASATPSTSMGASVIPASTARKLQKSIRTGKLDADERLVGGEANSASEDETEGAQELLELLRRGELYNLGPDGNYLHGISPIGGGQTATKPPSAPPAISKAVLDDVPPIDRPKTSKFKLSRSTGRPSPTLPSNQTSENDAPVSMVEKSSPKIPSPMTNSVIEKTPLHAMKPKPTIPGKPSANPSSLPITPTVSERRSAALANSPGSSSTFPSIIVDSPSFAPPTTTRVSADSSPFPMIVESPSFAKPAVPIVSPAVRSRPLRPPTIMSSAVRETSSVSSAGTGSERSEPSQNKSGKVSRFMAERS
ncbi:hypothetical protein DXG01_011707 [Tephrocybe rancida]|nr:hypothetical protein DXG01_011707 [Tephrocybe rancida]